MTTIEVGIRVDAKAFEAAIEKAKEQLRELERHLAAFKKTVETLPPIEVSVARDAPLVN